MNRETQQVILQLAQNARPVRPLRRPYVRAAVWVVISMIFVAGMVLIIPADHDLLRQFAERSFVIEQFAALATGIAAGLAAFVTVIPGGDRRWALLPLLPISLWLGSLAPSCFREFTRMGTQVFLVPHSLWCLPSIVLLGTVPALAMVVMLRRGAPLTPHLTAALGGLAAAGIGNIGVRFIHPEDVSVMLMVWHVGGVMLLCAFAGSAGRHFLNWRSIIGASENIAR
ncbi:MAG: DUF1109 domain-containing protein [Acidobacteria bacterium]|nr:MAG: DUF1109 domain-containing protein [Acidobacteriota bacterium]PYS16993.1 MAG: DUF1109 domain-containing protein [Acidobacteriota bacterium]